MKCRIALAQIDPVLGDPVKNVALHCEAVDRAIQANAQMVVFPELSLTGYSVKDLNWDLAIRPSNPPASYAPLLERSRQISILAGGIEEGETFGIYNSAFLCENGQMKSVHRKTYPPTYGMFEEMRYFSRGTSVRAIDTRIGRIGVLVCEDLWHLSLPYLLMLDGAEMVVSLTASPTRMGGDKETLRSAEVNGEHHRTYARLLSVYLAFCNRVGFEDGVNFWGGSSVIGPSGDTRASAKLFDTDFIVADIDDAELRRARRFSRHVIDEDAHLVLRELHRITGR
jgi:NAD+ synthase (glutamine-hydrolysing)